MDQRDKLLRTARKHNTPNDWLSYKSHRHLCTNHLRTARRNYQRNLLNENKDNPKTFWKCIKDIFPVKSKNKISASSSHQKEKAECFSNYFAGAVREIKTASNMLKNFVWSLPKYYPLRTNSVFKFKYVSVIFVCNQLKKLSRKKVTGLDNLPAGLLKDSTNIIVKPRTHIINLSLNTATFPTIWKSAKVVPVHKSRNKDFQANYRPISILLILSKIMERAVYSQLLSYLEDNNLLTSHQYGYCNKRSTSHAATKFVDDVRRDMDNGLMVGAVFIELSRAFDTLGHATLMTKQKMYGICGQEITWFNSYLFHRTQVVYIGNSKSVSQPLFSGVPQGSILGPLLFMTYFNDLADVLKSSRILMYADDTVVYFANHNIQSIEDTLNEEVEMISTYLDESELVINLKKGKTEVMLFGTAKRISKTDKSLHIVYKNVPLFQTTTYEYLGNTLDAKMNFQGDFEKRLQKASGRLRLFTKIRPLLTSNAAEKIFNSMIVPIITYCCIVKIRLTDTQKANLASIDYHASKLIYSRNSSKRVTSTYGRMQKQACSTVRKCITGNVCSPFKNYFKVNTHVRVTRNNNCSINLPKIKLEIGRQSFYYQGCRLYNELPLEIRKEEDYKNFIKKLNMIFK